MKTKKADMKFYLDEETRKKIVRKAIEKGICKSAYITEIVEKDK